MRTLALLVLLAVLAACGSSGSGSSDSGGGNPSSGNTGSTNASGGTSGGGNTGSGNVGAGTGATSTQHIVLVMFENQDYSSIIGNARMPFFNRLATQHGLATQFYATSHPSIGNYFMLTTGQPVTNDDAFSGTFSGDNIARRLGAAGKTWKVYAESLPSAGYTGDDVYPYLKHHNPFAYFDEVINSASQRANIVPFSQFATDLDNNALPSFALVVPNNLNSGHECADAIPICAPSERLPAMDAWLSANFAAVVQNNSFMNSSVLVVTLDESLTDNTNGGGRIPVILAGAGIKAGFQSTNTYQFPSLLKFSLTMLGVAGAPGAAAGAPDMGEFVK